MSIRITNRLFGTNPVAAHCPGPLHEHWYRFVDAVMAQPARQFECRDVTIVTWNSGARPSRPNKPCGVLERSLERLGVPVLVLGKGITNWRNSDKFALTAEALKRIDTPFILGADSCDVVFFDDPNIAVEQFRRHYACDLVYNATGSRCWPEFPEFVEFESSLPMAAVAQQRHWLNAGMFLGRTEFCREYFAKLAHERQVPGYEGSEQAIVKRTWPQWYPRVQIDYLSLLFQWFNEDRSVMRLERPPVARHRELLRWLRRRTMPLVGAEVGVFDGYTSEVLLRELPQLQLWMVDPWRPFEGAAQIDKLDAAEFQQVHEAAMWWTDFAKDRRFVVREPSPKAAARFRDQSLDFVFVDANHVYEHVCADVFAWWPKVRTGGLLTGHDYGVYGDAKGLWGVRRAVDEFAAHVQREVTVGDDGTWCLEK